jgi:hypothetical protein
MRFGELFGKSWQEYKSNFKVFLIIFLLLSVIPSVIYFVASIPLNLKFLNLTESGLSEMFSLMLQLKYVIPSIILGILMFLLGLLMSASFVYNSLYRKKEMSVRETLMGGKKYFWKYFLFSIVYFIFLGLLFLLFVIPGIIFLIFWMFASYILIGENKGILESLKISHDIVRGKWWRVFGYALLFMLIAIAISIGFSIVGGIINVIIGLPFLIKGATQSGFVYIITEFVRTIANLGAGVITTPLAILFFKNFYLDLKKGGKSKK